MTVSEFAAHIHTIGLRYNGSVISWGRSRARNQQVQGHEDSLHLSWLACDMVFDTVWGAEQSRLMAPRLGLFWKSNGELSTHFQALKPAA